MILKHTCEICGDVVVKMERATVCKHPVNLCEECKRACPGALHLCIKCEDKGVSTNDV